jgi:hypothetical protein
MKNFIKNNVPTILTIFFIIAFYIGISFYNQRRGNDRINTVENGVFSIAEIIEYRTETRNNYYRYSFLFRNKLFQSRCYCRGKSLVINQKYFLALDPEKPGYNNFLLYNYSVPDSITEAPPEGWKELPIPVDKEEIRKFLEDY